MLTQTLRTILERAAIDAAFREQLLSKPDEALAGYTLTADEAAQVRSLSRETIETFARDLSVLEGELSDEDLQSVFGARKGRGITTDDTIVI